MNNTPSASEIELRRELSSARRRLMIWRCVAIAVVGIAGLGIVLAAAPEGHDHDHAGSMIQVTSNEVIDLSKLSRVSRSPAGQAKTSVTFFFATEGEKTNFAIFGPEGDNAWAKLTERVGEKWTAAPAKQP